MCTCSSGRGRKSIRLTSKKAFDSGLVIIDLSHMPGSSQHMRFVHYGPIRVRSYLLLRYIAAGCGTWPAFWMVGPQWPSHGEIDIIEGVNVQTNVQTTLHSSEGCDMKVTG